MGRDIEFDYMEADRVLCHVIYTWDNKVYFENFSDSLCDKPFGLRDSVSKEDLMKFLEYRCVPRDRDNIDEILKCFDIPFYDPYKIVRKTHGIMINDANWIRFKGETLTYKEVREYMCLTVQDWVKEKYNME